MDTDEQSPLMAPNSESSDSEIVSVSPNSTQGQENLMDTSTEIKTPPDQRQSSTNNPNPGNWRNDLNISVFLLTILSAIGGFLFGYDTGVVSGAMLQIADDPRINLDTVWTELIVSVTVY